MIFNFYNSHISKIKKNCYDILKICAIQVQVSNYIYTFIVVSTYKIRINKYFIWNLVLAPSYFSFWPSKIIKSLNTIRLIELDLFRYFTCLMLTSQHLHIGVIKKTNEQHRTFLCEWYKYTYNLPVLGFCKWVIQKPMNSIKQKIRKLMFFNTYIYIHIC